MECSALSLPQQFSEFHACPPKSFNAMLAVREALLSAGWR